MSNSSQPAWHPDPEGVPDQLRWWDGQQWTSATRPAQFAPPAGPSGGKGGSKKWLIAVTGVVVALLAYISFAAITGFEPGEEDDEPAAASTTTRAQLAVPTTVAPPPPAATQTVSKIPCTDAPDAYLGVIEISLIDSSLTLENVQALTAPNGLVYIGADVMSNGERESGQDIWVVEDDAVFALSSSANEFTVLPDGRDLLDVNISAGDEYGSALQNCVARVRQR